MSLYTFIKKRSSAALALATVANPIGVPQVLASTLAPVHADVSIEMAQAAPSETLAQETTPDSEGGFTPAPADATPRTVPEAAPSATTIPLTERPDLIGACRRTNRSVEVFTDSALSPVNRVGTFAPNTEVKLTGVVGDGRAQVYWPTTWPPSGTITVVGWVNAAYLASCGIPPAPNEVCYRVNTDYLTVRSAPSVTAPIRGSLRAGTIINATTNPPTEQTAPSTPPEFGRIWTQIVFQGNPAWVARTGPGGVGNNITRLSDAECN